MARSEESGPDRREPRARRKVVVVTGASAGVGRAAAVAFGRRGFAVALVARGAKGLEGAAREVEEAGGEPLVFRADVADPAAVEAAAERVLARWGRIDVWVNNAMATIFAPVEEITPAEFRRVTEVTYLGQVHGTLTALAHMRRQGGGTIVQIGSALAYRSIPLQAPYCAAKAAVRAFTDSVRSELLHEGSPVRITMVHLPAVDTPQFDWARSRLPRRLQPVPPIHDTEVAAEAVVRAAREAPRELWVGVPTAQAILGTMAAPGLLDRMMARQAWDGQMTEEDASPRPDNLFEPVDVDAGAAGRFGARTKPQALVASATTVRAVLALAAAGTTAALFALARQQAARRTRTLPAVRRGSLESRSS